MSQQSRAKSNRIQIEEGAQRNYDTRTADKHTFCRRPPDDGVLVAQTVQQLLQYALHLSRRKQPRNNISKTDKADQRTIRQTRRENQTNGRTYGATRHELVPWLPPPRCCHRRLAPSHHQRLTHEKNNGSVRINRGKEQIDER